jgi:Fur family ferric uptake transcriptional regulator
MPGGRITPEPARSERRRRRTHRDTIIATLVEEGRFLSAREVHEATAGRRASSPVPLTTVYRLLHRLVDENRASVAYTRNGTALYRVSDSGTPHRYLLCRRCGRADPFSAPEVEQFCDRLAHLHGFTEVRSHLRVLGICPRCRPREDARARDTGSRPPDPHAASHVAERSPRAGKAGPRYVT